MKSQRRGSPFFSAMSSFFTSAVSDTQANPTSVHGVAKPKSKPSPNEASKRSAMVRTNSLKSKLTLKNQAEKTIITEVLDLTNDHTSVIKFQAMDEAHNEIPIVITINHDISSSQTPSSKKSESFTKKISHQLDTISSGDEKASSRLLFSANRDTVNRTETESAYLDECVDPLNHRVPMASKRSQSVSGRGKDTPSTGNTFGCEDYKIEGSGLESMEIPADEVVSELLDDNGNISFEVPIHSTPKAKRSKVAEPKREKCRIPNTDEHLLGDSPGRRNSNKMRFRCSICFKCFNYKGFLIRHLKDHLSSSQIGDGIEKNDMELLALELKKVEEIDLDGKTDGIEQMHRALETVNSDSSLLVKLIHDINGGAKNLACGYCDECFPSQLALVEHCRTHMADRPFMCNICGTLFKQNAALVYHTRIHFDMIRSHRKKFTSTPFIRYVLKLYSCHDCNRSYVSWPALNQHRENVHGVSIDNLENPDKKKDPGVNEIDPSSSQSKNSANTDELLSNDQPKISTKSRRSLDVTKKYSCYKCSEIFPTQFLFKKHPCCHRNCLRCGELYKSKFHYQDNAFNCCLCEQSFSAVSMLINHLGTHQAQPSSYICDVCGKMFEWNKGLKRHLKIHHTINSFRCEICGKMFQTGGYLARHLRVHKTDKRYQCEYCDKFFRFGIELRKHMSQCDKIVETTSRQRDKIEASELERIVKVFNCEVCDEIFSEKLKFRNHYLSHFGIVSSAGFQV